MNNTEVNKIKSAILNLSTASNDDVVILNSVHLLIKSTSNVSDSDCIEIGFNNQQIYVNTIENLIFDFIVKYSSKDNYEEITEKFIVLDKTKAHFKQSLIQLSSSSEFKQKIELLYQGNKADFTIQYDIPYGENTSTKHAFDIYRGPQREEIESSDEKIQSGSPVVLYFHGGAWSHGNKFSAIKRLRHFLDQDIVFISVGYRLIDEAIWPAQINDAEAVLRQVIESAEELGIDSQRIGLWGSSAGAHLATLLATKFPEEVKGLVNYCGPLTFDNHIESLSDETQQHSPIFLLLGGQHPELSRYAYEANPLNWIKKDELKTFPKTIIFHGTEDTIVPFSESELLNKLLQEKELDSKLVALVDTGHRIDDLDTFVEIKKHFEYL